MMGCDKSRKRAAVRLAAVAALVAALAAPASGLAEDTEKAKQDAGIGLATAMANIFYIPAKLTYAALGGITGGLTYALTLGNTEAAEKVWVTSGGGDYVLSTEHVSGQRKVHFTGSQPDAAPEF